MDIYIYALIDPRTGNPFYVGKTNSMKVRLKGHRTGRGKTRCAAYIRGLREEGLRPSMRLLETSDLDHWEDDERKWIKTVNCGHPLENVSDGGQPGYFGERSKLTRERLRNKFLGRPIPQEQRDQISKSLTGLKQSSETIAKRLATINARRAAKGLPPHNSFESYEEYRADDRRKYVEYRREQRRKQGKLVVGSEEWKRNLAEKARAQYEAKTPEQKDEFVHFWKGKPGANKGKKFGPMSPERRKQQSEKLKAYLSTLTPEQREARMAAARAEKKRRRYTCN